MLVQINPNPAPAAANSMENAAAAAMDEFLAQVEQRAYRSAILTTRRSADALDIVQDTMLQLVQHYRGRTPGEWPLLFQRILQNRLMDWHRQQTKQRKWFWQQTPSDNEDEEHDPLLEIADERALNPAELLAHAQDIERVIRALENLPLRQRQAFMLRAWDGFDVSGTAQAMVCSEGSVKTHYFRALQTLRAVLSDPN